MAAKEKVSSVEELEKKVDNLCAVVRRMQENWGRFAESHLGRPSDGKKKGEVGSARIGILAVIAVIGLSVIAYGAELFDLSQGTGTAKFEQTSRTGDITLTVDAGVFASGTTVGTDGSGSGTNAQSTVALTYAENGNKTITMTLALTPIVMTPAADDTTNAIGSVVLLNLPEGLWNFDGTVVNDLTLNATNIYMDATNKWTFGVGSSAASGFGALSGTEINFASTNTPIQVTNVYDTVSTTGNLVLDGTASGITVSLNCVVDAAAGSAFTEVTTNFVNGTIVINGKNVGDN